MFYPVNDYNYAYASLLLPMTGANGSTAFTDYSKNPKTVTRVGSPTISTTQALYNQGSGYFNADATYLSIADHADFALGTGDFLIDWYYYPLTVSNPSDFFAKGTAGVDGCSVWCDTSGVLNLGLSNLGIVLTFSTLAVNTWCYCALSRVSGSFYLIKDTSISPPYVSSINLTVTAPFIIANNRAFLARCRGYIQNFRVFKGIGYNKATYSKPNGPMFLRPSPRQALEITHQRMQGDVARWGM